MAQQAGGAGSGSGALGNQFGDTTYTKVFVGGLAWETQRETMRRHFEQFGEILEAVVITDKNTGRSKGYGFVTFRDADSAKRACADPTPVIDGRRANCNLASLGAHRHRPQHQHGNRFRPVSPFSAGPQQGGPGFSGAGSFPQTGSPYGHPAPQAFYPPYGGYPQYPQDYANYPQNLFQYGGPQYGPQMFGGPTALSPGSGPVYPYGSFTTQPLQGAPVYPGSQYAAFQTPHLYGPGGANLTTLPQAYGGAGTIPTSTPTADSEIGSLQLQALEHPSTLTPASATLPHLESLNISSASPSLSAGTVAGQVSPQQYAGPSGSQQAYSSGGGSEQQSG